MCLLHGDMSPEFGSPGLGLRTDMGRPAKRLWGGGRWRIDGCGLRRVRHGRITRGYTISQGGRWTMQGRERRREGRRYDDDDVRFDTPRRGEAWVSAGNGPRALPRFKSYAVRGRASTSRIHLAAEAPRMWQRKRNRGGYSRSGRGSWSLRTLGSVLTIRVIQPYTLVPFNIYRS